MNPNDKDLSVNLKKLTMVMLVVGVLAGCSGGEKNQENASVDTKDAQAQLAESQKEMNAKLDQLKKEIERLEAKAKDAEGEEKAKMEAQLKDLEKQKSSLKDQLSEATKDAEAKLEDAKESAEKEADKLKESAGDLLKGVGE